MQTHGYGDGKTHEGDDSSLALIARLRDAAKIELPAREDWQTVYAPATRDSSRTFEAEHADEISKVEQGWASIREDAAELGWAPDKPFAR